ncbi:unnamed protein product [Sphenostylis stenocarpa]|uniref:Uncharacterized protein n=1 Tax=Sphenostylis stenocarpa TaxID=92480 RepID=A0AA86VVG1_9FABA|nr:unnamed protein product [Sphenostylis stenocarpa]
MSRILRLLQVFKPYTVVCSVHRICQGKNAVTAWIGASQISEGFLKTRFEIYPFYDSTTVLDPAPVSVSRKTESFIVKRVRRRKEKNHGNSLRTAIVIVVPTVLVVLALLIVISRYFRRIAMKNLLPVKSDVFSFGVLVLEIVSGQKNHYICNEKNGEDVLNFAWRNSVEGTVTSFIDLTLKNNSSQNEMIRCIHIDLLCVEETLNNRPTMANVALMLNTCSITLPVPKKNLHFLWIVQLEAFQTCHGKVNSLQTKSTQSTARSAQESLNEASITQLHPR